MQCEKKENLSNSVCFLCIKTSCTAELLIEMQFNQVGIFGIGFTSHPTNYPPPQIPSIHRPLCAIVSLFSLLSPRVSTMHSSGFPFIISLSLIYQRSYRQSDLYTSRATLNCAPRSLDWALHIAVLISIFMQMPPGPNKCSCAVCQTGTNLLRCIRCSLLLRMSLSMYTHKDI